jgi:hypothetical protein
MPAAPPAATAEPPRWQSIATVLLILHFFCLGVAVLVNMGAGKSMIGQALRRIPFVPQYLQFLQMDLAYEFPLAGAGPDDGVHRLQLLRADVAPDSTGAVLAELPDNTMVLRIRRQRYQHLASHVAYFDELFDENSDLRTKTPLSIVGRWTKAAGLEPGEYTLRCLRIPPKRLPQAIAAEVTYAYVMREGGLQQQVVEKPPPPPITIHLVWDPVEGRYQGARETAVGQRSEVVQPVSAAPQN